MSETIIDKNAKQITFTNNGIGFSQFGVANEILDLIENQAQENESLNNIINELEKWLKNKIDGWKDDKNVSDTIYHERLAIRMIYDYLQELKDSDKE